MRIVLPLIALVLATGATGPSDAPPVVPPEPVPGTSSARTDQEAVCNDRIELVRQERGLPQLQRDTASSDALLIATVDQRVDGCAVMVMRNNTSDVRPLPAPSGDARFQRVR